MMSPGKINQRESDALYIMKMFAIVAVITAHTTYQQCSSEIVGIFLGNFAASGVCNFFLLSGYFFQNDSSFGEFIAKKARSLCIPWIIASTVIYAIRFIGVGIYVDFKEYINFVFGNGSLYYYLTVLLVLYVAFWVLGKRKIVLYFCVFIGFLSIVLTTTGVIPSSIHTDLWFFEYWSNPYLNIFNWIGFFAFGMILRDINIENLPPWFKWTIALVGVGIWIVLTVAGMRASYYWSYLSIVNEALLVVVIYNISWFLAGTSVKVLREVGKLTLPVYLYHLPFTSYIFAGNISIAATISRPVVILIICFTVFYALKKSFLKKTVELLLGIK